MSTRYHPGRPEGRACGGLRCSVNPPLESGKPQRVAPGRLRVSRSAMRVCQPGPLAFQAARVSGGSRSEMGVRGFPLFGRPRGLSSGAAVSGGRSSGNTSRAGRARAKVFAVHSGLGLAVRARRGVDLERCFMSLCVAGTLGRVERQIRHFIFVYTVNKAAHCSAFESSIGCERSRRQLQIRRDWPKTSGGRLHAARAARGQLATLGAVISPAQRSETNP